MCSLSTTAFVLQPEHQSLIADAGALPHIVDLLKMHKDSLNSQAVNGVIRRAADAINNLAHENSSIKIRVRLFSLLSLMLLDIFVFSVF